MRKRFFKKFLPILIHLLVLFFLYKAYFFVFRLIGQCTSTDGDWNNQCIIERDKRETLHIIILSSFYITTFIILPKIVKALLRKRKG